MPAQIAIDKTSLALALQNLDALGVSGKRAAYTAVRAGGAALEFEIRDALTYEDHTLEELADLDHPYARRHGAIRLSHGSGDGFLEDTDHAIHDQSGRLGSAVRSKTSRTGSEGNGPTFQLWVDLGVAPYFRMLTEGTETMLPRDPLWETASSERAKTTLRKIVSEAFDKDLAAQVATYRK